MIVPSPFHDRFATVPTCENCRFLIICQGWMGALVVRPFQPS